MDPQNRPDPPSNLPAVPTPDTRQPPPGPDPWATGRRRADGPEAPPPGAPSWLRRLRPRSPRLAAGLGLAVAALLLLPFLDDPGRWWVPVGLGFGTLVLLYLLRLDRLLLGWAPHVAGLVLVVALVWATSANPWAWGLAVGVGVALAGLLLLPRWQVLAVGVVVLAVSAVGYQFRAGELAATAQAQIQQTQDENRGQLGAPSVRGIVPLLLTNIARNNSSPICDNLLTGDAAIAFAASAGAPDCPGAVARLRAAVSDPEHYGSGSAPVQDRAADALIDACAIRWRTDGTPGPQIGRLTAGHTTGTTFVITGFQPCP